MIPDFTSPNFARCPSASTASLSLQCDNERKAMLQEIRRLTAIVKAVEGELHQLKYWRDHWAQVAKDLSEQVSIGLVAR